MKSVLKDSCTCMHIHPHAPRWWLAASSPSTSMEAFWSTKTHHLESFPLLSDLHNLIIFKNLFLVVFRSCFENGYWLCFKTWTVQLDKEDEEQPRFSEVFAVFWLPALGFAQSFPKIPWNLFLVWFHIFNSVPICIQMTASLITCAQRKPSGIYRDSLDQPGGHQLQVRKESQVRELIQLVTHPVTQLDE